MNKRAWFWMLLLIGLLTACAPTAETVTVPVTRTTATAVPPTAAPTHTLLPPTPTPETAVTETPLPTPTPFPIVTPEPTTTSLPTPDPSALTITVLLNETSPNGRWQADVTRSEEIWVGEQFQFFLTLTVRDLEGEAVWRPVAEWRGSGLGESVAAPFRWSADGRFLYFSNVSRPDGCALFSGATDLSRLDLQEGRVVALLPAYATRTLAMSPNEELIAYPYGRALRLLEIAVGFDNDGGVINAPNSAAGAWELPLDVSEDSYQVGNIVWSPDGRRLLLTVAHNPCFLDWSHSTLLVDLDLTVFTLIDHDPRQFTIEAWAKPETARLVDKDGALWELDVASGMVTAVSP